MLFVLLVLSESVEDSLHQELVLVCTQVAVQKSLAHHILFVSDVVLPGLEHVAQSVVSLSPHFCGAQLQLVESNLLELILSKFTSQHMASHLVNQFI